MKLLLDEMYAGLKEYFEVMDWKVTTVHEAELQGCKDREIVDYARKHDLLLVTQDQKPADLAEIMNVRYVLISNLSIAKMASEMINDKYGT